MPYPESELTDRLKQLAKVKHANSSIQFLGERIDFIIGKADDDLLKPVGNIPQGRINQKRHRLGLDIIIPFSFLPCTAEGDEGGIAAINFPSSNEAKGDSLAEP